ncbi:MAG: MurR/RpiR family transcriptional regulator [Rhizobiaceae bacterium]|nr:MurR/RpiR family transcriptional regulator [Rhizobiaceae bacterium]
MVDGENAEAPKDFETLRALIIERRATLPKRLAQVAIYALDNPDEVAFGTAASVAQSAEVQPSTLVRFAQSFGFQGFSDLQDVFRARLRERVPSYDERIERMRQHGITASRSNLILDGFLEATEQSVAGFRSGADRDALDRAVDLLAQAHTIYLIGLRRSFPITSYMSYAMGKLGVRNILVDAVAGMASEQAGFIGDKDAALAISFTPYANETVSLVGSAKARGARIVSVTDSIFSPISAPADVLIEIGEANFEGFRSMAATMAVAMALSVAVAARRGGG